MQNLVLLVMSDAGFFFIAETHDVTSTSLAKYNKIKRLLEG